MNLILLSSSDISSGTGTVRVTGRRLEHIREVLKPKLHDVLTVGVENGPVGEGQVTEIGRDAVELQVSFRSDPPVKLPVILCCALMRPPVFRRVLQTAAAMGVGDLRFFQSRRVEKSFWQSTCLTDKAVREELILGLEQAKDTVLPEVHFHKRFRPFVEDVLPVLLQGRIGIVADPSGERLDIRHRTLDKRDMIDHRRQSGAVDSSSCVLCPVSCVLILGPEGGFIPYELEKFRQVGCRVVSLGERVLRVETAVVALLAKLY